MYLMKIGKDCITAWNSSMDWNSGGGNPFTHFTNEKTIISCFITLYPQSSDSGLVRSKYSTKGLESCANCPRSPTLPASFGSESDRKVSGGLGGESEVSHPDFSEGSGLRLPRDLPTCVFGTPRPSQRFTPSSYSEMNHFCFFQLATTGAPGWGSWAEAVVLA